MKNNLFRKFLALFLTGTMLAGVGCKDYDDDIDDINKRLDGMDVTVADLQTQITNVKNSIPTLDEINSKVASLSDGLETVKGKITTIDGQITGIQDAQKKLEQAAADLKTYVNSQIQSSEATLRKEIATKATAADIQAAIDALRTELVTEIQKNASSISTLSSQFTAHESAQTKELEQLNKELQELLKQITDLQQQIKNLPDNSKDVADLKAAIEDLANNKVIKNLQDQIDILNNAPAPEIPDYTEKLENLEGRLAALEETKHLTMTDVTAEVNRLIDELKNNKPWLGEDMNGAIEAYLTQHAYVTSATLSSSINTAKGEAQSETIKALIAQIEKREGDYVTKLTELIKEQFTTTNLDEVISGFVSGMQNDITSLKSKVAELENRIQSLVWVPATLDQATANKIDFKSVPSITLTSTKDAKKTKTIYLNEAEGQSATLTFRVTPASVVKKIQEKGTLSIVPERLLKTPAATRAAGDIFQIVPEKTEYDLEKGKITIVVKTDYLFGQKEPDGSVFTPALALKVEIAPADETAPVEEDAAKSVGVEYISQFIATDFDDAATEITPDNLVFAALVVDKEGNPVKDKDGNLQYTDVKYGNKTEATYKTKIPYTTVGEQKFLDDVKLYFKDGKEYKEASALWTAFPELVCTNVQVDKKDVKAQVTPDTNKDSYEFGVNSFTIKENKVELIGDVVKSGEFAYTLKADEYELSLGKLAHAVTIDAITTDLNVPEQAFTWKYGETRYEAKVTEIGGKISADVYNQIAKQNSKNLIVWGKDKDGKDVEIAGLTAELAYTATPTEDKDAQKIQLILNDANDALIVDGKYTVKKEYMLADKTKVAVEVPVQVTGMPELADFAIPAKELIYNGDLQYTLLAPSKDEVEAGKDVANLIWNNYKTVLANCFTEDKFVQMLKDAAIEYQDAMDPKDDKKKVSNLMAINNLSAIDVVFQSADAGTSAPGMTFTEGKIKIVVTSNVTLKKPVVTLVEQSEILKNGVATASTELTTSGYKVVNKELDGAYTKSEGTPTAAKIVYSLNYTAKELAAMQKALAKELNVEEAAVIMPTVTNNVLNWGDYNKRSLKLKAQIVLNGAALAEAEFMVQIADPIADAAISQKKDTKGKVVEAVFYEEDASKTLSIPEYLVLNTINGKNVYDPTNAAFNNVLGGKTTYTKTAGSNLVTVDETSGVVTYTPSGSLQLTEDLTVKVAVKYNYLYDEGKAKVGEITVTVKKGARPAEK